MVNSIDQIVFTMPVRFDIRYLLHRVECELADTNKETIGHGCTQARTLVNKLVADGLLVRVSGHEYEFFYLAHNSEGVEFGRQRGPIVPDLTAPFHYA